MKKRVLYLLALMSLFTCFWAGCNAQRDPKCDHVEVTIDAVRATCRREGMTEGKYCELCNEVLVKQQIIPKTEHNVAPKTNSVMPTCITSGRTEGKICIDCLVVLEEVEIIPPLEHSEGIDDAVPPTCTEEGLTEGKYCTYCYLSLVPQKSIPKLEHDEVIDKAVSVTCTQNGITEGKHCSVCNTVLVEQKTIPAKGHTTVDVDAILPTCTTNGKSNSRFCSTCNTVFVEQVVLNAFGHTEVVDKAIAATCEKDGKTEGKHCSVCNEILIPQNTIEAKGHKEVIDAAVPATCAKDGVTEGKHCSVCNTVIISQKKIPASHTAGQWIIDKESTCTEPGSKHQECSICMAIIDLEIIEANGHRYHETVTPATVNSCASVLYDCDMCQYSYSMDVSQIYVSAALTGSGIVVSTGTYYTRSFKVTASGGYGKYKYKFYSGTNILQDYSENNTITVQGNVFIDLAKITISVIDEAGQESIYIIQGNGTYVDSYVNYN